MLKKVINNVCNRIFGKSKNYPSFQEEYMFNSDDLADLNKQNKTKIKNLKKDISFKKDADEKREVIVNDNEHSNKECNEEENKKKNKEEVSNNQNIEACRRVHIDDLKKDNDKIIEVISKANKNTADNFEDNKVKESNSFIDMSEKYQDYIMNKLNEVDELEINDDIKKGKELLENNSTITFADEATSYINHIRSKYEAVISYLIGFNNEKKGIYGMTVFSLKKDEEWMYLSNYIKILEKIKTFRN